ncbi:hypothetical protein WJ967_14555 [Achromobacter xylosoxidans]
MSGYLGTRPHAVGEWMAQGGNVEFSGGDVVTRAGSSINLSGGTLDVQDGMIRQSWLRGADGRLYEVSRAPGDLAYAGLYLGYEARSARWGQTRYFYNPLLAPRERFETGYTVGRDAGRLLVGTSGAVLEGELLGATFLGERQSVAARSDLDGYQQSQRAGRAARNWWWAPTRPITTSAAGRCGTHWNAIRTPPRASCWTRGWQPSPAAWNWTPPCPRTAAPTSCSTAHG